MELSAATLLIYICCRFLLLLRRCSLCFCLSYFLQCCDCLSSGLDWQRGSWVLFSSTCQSDTRVGHVTPDLQVTTAARYFWMQDRTRTRTRLSLIGCTVGCWCEKVLRFIKTLHIWSNLSLTSKNLAHRFIHFKVIHRAYITPYKRFQMKLQSNLNCHICNTTSSGTFPHMFWECPVVISLCTHVNLVLSSLLRIDWSVNPSLCRLNDDSGLCISSMQKRMLFAGFTAVKKTIIQNWFTKTYWIRSLLQIVTCECATARVGGARPSTIDAWQCFLFDIRDYIKEWLLCFYCPSLSPSLLIGLWDVEYVSVVLFCYILDAVLCYVWKI